MDALRAGARIETMRLQKSSNSCWMPSVRGRELKLTHLLVWKIDRMMPSVRGRELKLLPQGHHPGQHLDALRAGARIETQTMNVSAPFAPMPSVRGRELKPRRVRDHRGGSVDALRAGARIETSTSGSRASSRQ